MKAVPSDGEDTDKLDCACDTGRTTNTYIHLGNLEVSSQTKPAITIKPNYYSLMGISPLEIKFYTYTHRKKKPVDKNSELYYD